MSFLSQFIRSLWVRATGGYVTPEPVCAELSTDRESSFEYLSDRLGYVFNDPALLDRALTHKSFVNSLPKGERSLRHYESLEFLGDAVLDLVISEFLLREYPELLEGELTRIRASLVSVTPLKRLSRDLGLGEYLRLSKGEEKTGGRNKRAILADLFESLVAAIYLDGGLEPARRFILAQFDSLLTNIDLETADFRDHKSKLQELLHSRGIQEPGYIVIDESGPDHRKEFLIEVRIGRKGLAQGRGTAKKRAEQEAARRAFQILTTEAGLLDNLAGD